MKLSIKDAATVWKDPEAKSVGYFSRMPTSSVSRELVDQLQDEARRTGQNVRVSLHARPESRLHNMIICTHLDNYFRPKRHPHKAKVFQVIAGSFGVFTFDINGHITNACHMSPDTNLICRIGADVYHADVPISDLVVHHEITTGPFNPETDREFAPFAPVPGTAAFLKFRDHLWEHI